MIYTLTLNPAVDRELTVPAIEFDSVLRATGARVDVGGKGFNVSRLLKGLGIDSTAVGFLGGKAGEILQEGLQALDIGVDFVWVPGETRTNVSIVTEMGGHYLKVNEKGPPVEDASQAALLDRLDALAQPGDWWVLAGSLPPGISADFYARILGVLNRHQSMAVLDTSDQPFVLGCAQRPYLVKPNAQEASAVTGLPVGTPHEAALAAGEIGKMGAQNVIISLGKAGALLRTAAGVWLAHSPPIEEKNPIGAGDSMLGGLVAALMRGASPDEALRWGVACGAATASLGGTEVGSRPLVESLLARVGCEQLQTV